MPHLCLWRGSRACSHIHQLGGRLSTYARTPPCRRGSCARQPWPLCGAAGGRAGEACVGQGRFWCAGRRARRRAPGSCAPREARKNETASEELTSSIGLCWRWVSLRRALHIVVHLVYGLHGTHNIVVQWRRCFQAIAMTSSHVKYAGGQPSAWARPYSSWRPFFSTVQSNLTTARMACRI